MIFVDQDVFLLIGFIPVIRIKKKDISILHSGHQDIVLFVQIQTDNCHAAVVQCMIDAALLTYVHASSRQVFTAHGHDSKLSVLI